MKLLPLRKHRQAGSAVVAALGVLIVSSVVVGATLFEARNRFRASHHSGRWSQAGQAAEAGVELALMSAQNNLWVTDGWTAAPGKPGTTAISRTFNLSSGVPATGAVNVVVSVDKIAANNLNWLRVRSVGQADLSGGALAGIDSNDVMLRKVSLRRDRTTGQTITTPRATRVLEILAKPISPYTRAILSDRQFNMSGGVIDSFDSSDPLKSTNRRYDVAKRQSNGDVGVNETSGASDLGGYSVYGDVAYSGPAIAGTSGVQGTISTPFNDPIEAMVVPSWTSVNATPNNINKAMTLTGGTKSSPARYKVSSVTLAGGDSLTLATHATGVESYVEIWVTGEFKASGSSQVILKSGVHVTYYVEGDIHATGTTFVNETNIAENNVINAVNPPAGTARTVDFTGGGEFIGAINAPAYDFTLTGNANFSGAMIGKTLTLKGGASLHYDEALGRADIEGGGYKVMSWAEPVR